MSDGDVACDIYRLLGLEADGTQRDVMRDWLALDDDGGYVHRTCLLMAPRQNMKSFVLRCRAIYGAVVRGESVLYTAHNYDTTCEMRDVLLGCFGRKANDKDAEYPWLNKRVSRICLVSCHESIKLKNGGCIYFSTRTKNAKRGYTVDTVIYDEAQELRGEHIAAITPTAASGRLRNPQFVYAGTPPTPGCFGTVFQPLRDALIAGAGDGSSCISEWSVSDVEGWTLADVADRRYWYMTNPALGTRITEAAVAAELDGSASDPLSFAQERLGYWLPAAEVNAAVKRVEWGACLIDSPTAHPDEVLCFALKFSSDGTDAAIAACVRAPGGMPHVEVVRYGPMAKGVREYVEFLAARSATADMVVVDGRSFAAAAVEDLRRSGFPSKRITEPRATEVADACSGLLNSIRSRSMTAYAGNEVLGDSICGCGVRKIGQGGGWGFADAGDSRACVAEAAALALWACRKVRKHRGSGDGKVRIG